MAALHGLPHVPGGVQGPRTALRRARSIRRLWRRTRWGRTPRRYGVPATRGSCNHCEKPECVARLPGRLPCTWTRRTARCSTTTRRASAASTCVKACPYGVPQHTGPTPEDSRKCDGCLPAAREAGEAAGLRGRVPAARPRVRRHRSRRAARRGIPRRWTPSRCCPTRRRPRRAWPSSAKPAALEAGFTQIVI